jgi:hypothetical protein
VSERRKLSGKLPLHAGRPVSAMAVLYSFRSYSFSFSFSYSFLFSFFVVV